MTPERILIVGGSGFIGTALTRELHTHRPGLALRVMGRSALPRAPLPAGVEYLQGDASSRSSVLKALAGVTHVIDLAYATVPKTSFDDPLFDVTANLPASVNLLQLASQHTLARYLLVSSGGTVYGQSQTLTVNETHPTNPISPYGISKLLTEKYGTFFHQMAGLPLVIARPANPYGADQIGQIAQGFIGAAIGAARAGRPLTMYGERGTVRDYVHIDDLVRGLRLCLEQGRAGATYNLGTGIGTDNARVVDLLRHTSLAAQLQVNHLPERVFDVKRNILDATLAEREFGWRCAIELNDGLQQMVDPR